MKPSLEVQLADVNVLFALFWPRHIHHMQALQWFADSGHKGWATNAITQTGFLRLVTNPAVTCNFVSPATALATLQQATAHPNHVFWALDLPVARLATAPGGAVSGHGQWTDLVLLGQAVERGGKLVTFDSGLKQLAARGTTRHLLVLLDRSN